jgi:hypothetical protein
MGGFSCSSVPRPRAPLSRRRRPLRPFFNRLRLPFVTGYHIHLVTFDLPGQARLGFARHNPLTQLTGHRLHVAFVQPQLLGDRLIGQIQAQEIPTQNPYPQGLMMTGKNRVRQIVKVPMTALAVVFLPRRLGGIPALFGHLPGVTVRTAHTLGPAPLAHCLVALGIINQILEVDHRRISSCSARDRKLHRVAFYRMTVRGLGITTTTGETTEVTRTFGGTSSATPLVAGIAGLTLSANPNLSALELISILKQTAAKDLEFQAYSQTPPANFDPDTSWDVSPIAPFDKGEFVDNGDEEGPWSPWFGCGRVDAKAAITEVLNRRPTTGDKRFRGSSSPDKSIPDNHYRTGADQGKLNRWALRLAPKTGDKQR